MVWRFPLLSAQLRSLVLELMIESNFSELLCHHKPKEAFEPPVKSFQVTQVLIISKISVCVGRGGSPATRPHGEPARDVQNPKYPGRNTGAPGGDVTDCIRRQ